MSHRPRKRFGQNFLQDQAVIGRIIDAINPQPADTMVEIGPGLAALTVPLLRRLNQLIAIEIDTDLQQRLLELPKAKEKLQLLGADALTVDFSQWGSDLRVVGNLPYNISTPLLLHLLHQVTFIRDMHFMLQKEVVSRIAAEPGSKAYGRLSIMAQYYCEASFLFDVPPDAFFPKPKVDSAILRLVPYQQSPFEKVDYGVLEKVVALAFGMRRKTLANNLKPVLSADQLQGIGINPVMRPEQVSVREYVRIANAVGNSIKL
ncbi:dimethyladenosine transferase (16S rRNA dimethylase) [Legionella rubrilucens]|uniref:Ribosomal RNA small subunit methyltransferase A n=1 Tax=Legionella rubrilucens TaxID=458 RepID=A0A0W0XMX0_9GAMM|nr:16S rRNA (adenine(1518)-N(6)/adenine(1519)-N(6))-dimethyltransferase RsmA [Legionella rubrilucens]KTD45812.1 dimethyladenosine transferase (16S rRNA dimethylase) [Legionella rubrilucens]